MGGWSRLQPSQGAAPGRAAFRWCAQGASLPTGTRRRASVHHRIGDAPRLSGVNDPDAGDDEALDEHDDVGSGELAEHVHDRRVGGRGDDDHVHGYGAGIAEPLEQEAGLEGFSPGEQCEQRGVDQGNDQRPHAELGVVQKVRSRLVEGSQVQREALDVGDGHLDNGDDLIEGQKGQPSLDAAQVGGVVGGHVRRFSRATSNIRLL